MVDEAQDLTDLEWAIIDKIAKKSNNLYLVGDDDQAIYGWKGSEVSKFQTWPCDEKDVRFLKKSYRLPTNIHHFVTTESYQKYTLEWVILILAQEKVMVFIR